MTLLSLITAFMLLPVLMNAVVSVAPAVPEGYEDEQGFHFGSKTSRGSA